MWRKVGRPITEINVERPINIKGLKKECPVIAIAEIPIYVKDTYVEETFYILNQRQHNILGVS